jgi:hypothetical protein
MSVDVYFKKSSVNIARLSITSQTEKTFLQDPLFWNPEYS